MGIFLFFACQPIHAASKKTADPEQNQQVAAEAAKQDGREVRFTPEEVEAIAAALPDGKAKDNFLKGFAAAKKDEEPAKSNVRTGEGAAVYYHEGASAVYTAEKRLLAYFTQPSTQSGEWKAALNNINKGAGLGHLMRSILVAALIVTIGLFAERMVKRATQPLRRQILEKARLGSLRFLGRVISNLFLNILGFAAYILTTYIIAALLYSPANPVFFLYGLSGLAVNADRSSLSRSAG
jgi:hypothetical protein